MDRNGLGVCYYGDDVSSLSARRAWIEIFIRSFVLFSCPLSLSARRAWIEIKPIRLSSDFARVALRKESVDRNASPSPDTHTTSQSLSARRAWIEMFCRASAEKQKVSLSARRAWIEIFPALSRGAGGYKSLSARRAWIEIDWASVITAMTSQSLSARRAWIEMFLSMGLDGRFKVALRKESVDRNQVSVPYATPTKRRSPQGERG